MQVGAVVAEEDPNPVRLVVVAREIVRLGRRELDRTAQSSELVAQRLAQSCRLLRRDTDGQKINVRLA